MKTYSVLIFDCLSLTAEWAEAISRVQSRNVPVVLITPTTKLKYAPVLEQYGLQPDMCFSYGWFSKRGIGHKPAPDMYFSAMAQLHVQAEDVLSLCLNDDDRAANTAAGLDVIDISPDELSSLMNDSYVAPVWADKTTCVPTTGLMGTVCGDIIGVPYERPEEKRTKDFNFKMFATGSKYSDDTILTCAIADWLMGERSNERLISLMKQYGREWKHPVGFSVNTRRWIFSNDTAPCGSFGNGSAMRVSPVGWVAKSLDEALALARQTAEVTHNTEEGIRGAQSVAACVFLIRNGWTKDAIRSYVEKEFGYDLSQTPEAIRPAYGFYGNCEDSVPQSICCWLYSDTFEECIRNAVSLGGDADTMAAIAGSIAAATPGMPIPQAMADKAWSYLTPHIRETILRFGSMM